MGMERKEHDMISRMSMAFLFSTEHRLDTTGVRPFERTYERATRAHLLLATINSELSVDGIPVLV